MSKRFNWLGGLLLALAVGCGTVQPGADPIIVNAERLQTSAKASFELVLKLDHSNRAFWQQNAPAFHTFCETLRKPTPYPGRTALPQYRVWLLKLDDAKLAYKEGRTDGQPLANAINLIETAVTQANAWSIIVQQAANPNTP